jgi:hypothetical protein
MRSPPRKLGHLVEEIRIPPIKSAISYAAALHEIGHIQGRYQTSRHSLVRELAAWRWARQQALAWTPAMERMCASSLAWAARNGRINSGGQARGLMRVRATHTSREHDESRRRPSLALRAIPQHDLRIHPLQCRSFTPSLSQVFKEEHMNPQ